MGNEQSIDKEVSDDVVMVSRFKVPVIKSGGGGYMYVYTSKEYGVTIQPSSHQNPVTAYEEVCPYDKTTRTYITVKRSLLENAKKYLDLHAKVTNLIQAQLAVN